MEPALCRDPQTGDDLPSGDDGRQDLFAAGVGVLSHRHRCGHHRGAGMHDAGHMGVVIIGAVDQGGVVQRGIRQRRFLVRTPQRGLGSASHGLHRALHSGGVFHVLAAHGHAERVCEQQLPVFRHIRRDVREPKGQRKLRDPPGERCLNFHISSPPPLFYTLRVL